MARKLTPLGHARVFRHPATGELVVDTDSLRRSSFSGEFAGEDFGDEDDLGYDDDFGDDIDEDDFGDDADFGVEDDVGDDDDFGARGRGRARRQARRATRQARRQTRRQGRKARRGGGAKDQRWGMTAVGGRDTQSEAGAASVKIRLQHDFKAQDITFTGSADGSKVTSIFFGDRVVWSNSDGIDVGVFASNSFMRGLLKGQSLRAGLDITVNGSTAGAGDFSATLIGEKPVGR